MGTPNPYVKLFFLIFAFGLLRASANSEVLDSRAEQDRPSTDEDFDFHQNILDVARTKERALLEIRKRIPELWQTSRRLRAFEGNRSVPTNAEKCNTDLSLLSESLSQKWMSIVIDSFGKPPSGIAKGALFWTGDFDQCNSFALPKTELFPDGLKTRYCILSLGEKSTSIKTGICVPNSCGTAELNGDYSGFINFLNKIWILNKFVKYLPKLSFVCLPESVEISSVAIGCIVFLALFFALTTGGTLYDVIMMYRKPKETLPVFSPNIKTTEKEPESSAAENSVNESVESRKPENDESAGLVPENKAKRNIAKDFLLCFSVLQNGKTVLDTSERPGQLNCLHGIRVISITWVILGHTYYFGMSEAGNIVDVIKQFNTWPFQAITNATLSVDTFFLLSGFLVTYLFLKERSEFTPFKLISMYTHRFIRLTPVYMVVLFVFGTLFNFIGDGPYWNYASQKENQCTKYWWRNILYINNLFPSADMCMGWSWYLANDMQFFIISPLFLALFKSSSTAKRWIGLSVLLCILLASWIATGVISESNDYPTLLHGFGDASEFQKAQQEVLGGMFDSLYDKPWSRIGPYLIGCLTGAAFIYVGNSRRFLNPIRSIIFWLAATALALTVVYGLYNQKLGVTTSAFYNALSRSAWSMAVAWVMFGCLTGYGGVVDKFLSWKFWFPLSRLTYCAYLVHPIILYFYYETLRTPIKFSNSMVAVHFLGFTVLTYGLALVTSITFEAPVIKLEKIIRQGVSKK